MGLSVQRQGLRAREAFHDRGGVFSPTIVFLTEGASHLRNCLKSFVFMLIFVTDLRHGID